MEQLYKDKHELRKWAKKERSKLDMKALSEELVQKLVLTQEYENAKNVMIFYPLKDEVNFLSLLDDSTKTFYLPKIDGENLLCCEFNKNTELCESCFHTMEPIAPSLQPSSTEREKAFLPDLVIVPALAADKNNYRLGYGKGFYDRFLRANKSNNVSFKTIVCIPKELIVETIFPNEYDYPVDLIITD